MRSFSIQPYLFGFLLCLATIASCFLVLQSSTMFTPNPTLDHLPDTYLNNVTVIRMDPDTGLPTNQLQAKTLIHFPEKNSSTILEPFFTFYQVNAEPWHLSAEYGKTQDGIEKITLWNHVRLKKSPGASNDPMEINTSQVDIYPNKQFAETQKPVSGTKPGIMLQGIGMHTNFKTGNIELLAKVQGTYSSKS